MPVLSGPVLWMLFPVMMTHLCWLTFPLLLQNTIGTCKKVGGRGWLGCWMDLFFSLCAKPNSLFQGQTCNFELNPMMLPNELQWKAETGSYPGFGEVTERPTSWRSRRTDVTDMPHSRVILGMSIGWSVLSAREVGSELAALWPVSAAWGPTFSALWTSLPEGGQHFFVITLHGYFREDRAVPLMEFRKR